MLAKTALVRKGPQTEAALALREARLALSVVRSLAGSTETKVYQQTTTQTNYLAGSVTLLSGISQGDTLSTRTGDSVKLTRLLFRLRLATFTDSDCVWRVIIFSDRRQVSGVTPTVTSVLSTDSAMSLYSPDTYGRWRVIKDMTFNQNARFLNGDMADDFVWDLKLSLKPRWAGGVGNYNADQLYCLITCDVAAAASMVGKPAAGDSATRFNAELQFKDD